MHAVRPSFVALLSTQEHFNFFLRHLHHYTRILYNRKSSDIHEIAIKIPKFHCFAKDLWLFRNSGASLPMSMKERDRKKLLVIGYITGTHFMSFKGNSCRFKEKEFESARKEFSEKSGIISMMKYSKIGVAQKG